MRKICNAIKKAFNTGIKYIPMIMGSTLAMAVIVFAVDAVSRCAVPIWHEEPELPDCLKKKMK